DDEGGLGALLHQRLEDLHFGRFVQRLHGVHFVFLHAAFIIRTVLRRASSRAFMASTMSFCTRSSKGIVSDILKDEAVAVHQAPSVAHVFNVPYWSPKLRHANCGHFAS